MQDLRDSLDLWAALHSNALSWGQVLDEVLLGRVGRQVENGGSCALDGLLYAWNLVAPPVVEENDLSRWEVENQHLVLNRENATLWEPGRSGASCWSMSRFHR
jgi:hypothetical protein